MKKTSCLLDHGGICGHVCPPTFEAVDSPGVPKSQGLKNKGPRLRQLKNATDESNNP